MLLCSTGFSQRVTNPTPFSSFYFYWQLICLGPQSILLLTLSDHFTFMILRRHLFTNICILFTVCLVILHVSELYGCVSEKGDHMGWPDSETNYKFVVHSREEIPVYCVIS